MTVPRSLTDTYTLNNGVKIPCIGYGTYQFKVTHEVSVDRNKHATQIGYRLFDTASFYMNEQGLGKALRASGVPREELFIVSKVWNAEQGYESTLAVIDESLEDLGFDYIDLYLIHWPIPHGHDDDWQKLNLETWRAMEKYYREGKLRAIGVSNFLENHLQPLMAEAEIPIMVNELEMNVGYYQSEIHKFCTSNDIRVISYSPMSGIDTVAPQLQDLCQKYGKTPAQISLRWNTQLGMIPIPRSYNYGRMQENIDIFDFELTAEELDYISSIYDDTRRHNHPDTYRFPYERHFKTKI